MVSVEGENTMIPEHSGDEYGPHLPNNHRRQSRSDPYSCSRLEIQRAAMCAAKLQVKGVTVPYHVNRDTLKGALLIIREGTPEEIALAESGKRGIRSIADQIRRRQDRTVGTRTERKMRVAVRTFRKAIIETEAGCVSLYERVAIPSDLDPDTRRFAVTALENARVHLSRLISTLKKGNENATRSK